MNCQVKTENGFDFFARPIGMPDGSKVWEAWAFDPNLRDFVRLSSDLHETQEQAEEAACQILADTAAYARSLIAFAYEQMRALHSVERAAKEAAKLAVKQHVADLGREMIRKAPLQSHATMDVTSPV